MLMAGNRRPTTGASGLPAAAGLAVAAAIALTVAAACGGGDGAGRDRATRAFCDEYAGYQDRFSAGASYGDVLEALQALDPPAEIADDFSALARAVEAMTTVDTSDPAAVAEFQEDTSTAAQEANANILEYVAAECDGDG
jgi:hypothetical protein